MYRGAPFILTVPHVAGRLKGSLQHLFDAGDGRVLPVCLPSAACGGRYDASAACYPAGRGAMLGGWGVLASGSRKRPKVVHYVNVPVIGNDQCYDSYEPEGLTITSQMICAGLKEGGKDTCQVGERVDLFE